MKGHDLSRTMLAATAFAMAVLLLAALAVPTCSRGSGNPVVVIVDTIVADTAQKAAARRQKAPRDSISGKKKPTTQRHKTPPESRNYLDESARE